MVYDKNNVSNDYMFYEYSNNGSNISKSENKSTIENNSGVSMIRAFYNISKQTRCSVILGYTILIFLILNTFLVGAFLLSAHFPCFLSNRGRHD